MYQLYCSTENRIQTLCPPQSKTVSGTKKTGTHMMSEGHGARITQGDKENPTNDQCYFTVVPCRTI